MASRVQLTDTLQDVIIKMGKGNPGAITVCMRLLTEGSAIDPDSAFGGFGNILDLDTLGIYEEKIWMLFKDVCKEDLIKMIAVLRGWQLGFVSKPNIIHAINNRGNGIDVDAILSKVQTELPDFGQNT